MAHPLLIRAILAVVLAALVGVSAWLQFGLLAVDAVSNAATDAPDYYIDNFTSSGVDRNGKIYQLRAVRLEHYPHAEFAELDAPQLIQYRPSLRQIDADSGRLYVDSGEILLRGNVTIDDAAQGQVQSNTMRIRLERGQ